MMKVGDPKWEGKEEKKLLKPLMEKRRRERMNRSLARLRLLLLEATRDERLRNPKVEKAEILQKTVEFLKRQPLPEEPPKEDALLESYRSGHRQCLAQASRFLRASPGLCPGQKAFCVDRICHCMEQLTPRPQPELPCVSLAPSNPRYEARPCYGPSVFGGCSPPPGDRRTPGLRGPPLAPPARDCSLACPAWPHRGQRAAAEPHRADSRSDGDPQD